MTTGSKQYLGDGVYVQFDDGVIILTTENGYQITNQIYLELDVYGNLRDYVNRLLDSEESNGQRS